MIRFPVFVRDTIRELLVKSGYKVVDLPWSPREVQVPKDEVKLLPFQERALDAWLRPVRGVRLSYQLAVVRHS